MNKLYILCGISGAGKSTVINELTSRGYCLPVTKYATRQSHGNIDDIISVSDKHAFPKNCDIIYDIYGNTYAISSCDIREKLTLTSQFVVINDYCSINILKNMFNNQIVVIYLMSTVTQEDLLSVYIERYGLVLNTAKKEALINILISCENCLNSDDLIYFPSSLESLYRALLSMIPNKESFRERIQSIENQLKTYTKNIMIYDYTVLNFYSLLDGKKKHYTEDAINQIIKIIECESKLI